MLGDLFRLVLTLSSSSHSHLIYRVSFYSTMPCLRVLLCHIFACSGDDAYIHFKFRIIDVKIYSMRKFTSDVAKIGGKY